MAPTRPHHLRVILSIASVHAVHQVAVDVSVEDRVKGEDRSWRRIDRDMSESSDLQTCRREGSEEEFKMSEDQSFFCSLEPSRILFEVLFDVREGEGRWERDNKEIHLDQRTGSREHQRRADELTEKFSFDPRHLLPLHCSGGQNRSAWVKRVRRKRRDAFIIDFVPFGKPCAPWRE
jgi:hypothetical protein